MKPKPILIVLLLLFSCTIFSQDKIYRKNGKVVEAKIVEVSSSEVKYREYANPDGPIYVLEADRIKKIVFADGKTETFTINIKDPEKYAGQRSQAVKLDFMGPLIGYSQFSYEKTKAPGKSYELSLGIIGLGKSWRLEYWDTQFRDVKREQFGFFAGGGYKFGKLPDFILFGKTSYSHLMQGSYAKPMVYVGHYKENRIAWKGGNQYVVEKQDVTFGAIQIEIGRQWIFNDKFLLDIYSGLGYGFDNKKESNAYYTDDNESLTAYNYANLRIGRSPGLSYTFALKVGMLLK
jgi:hypothetical protein